MQLKVVPRLTMAGGTKQKDKQRSVTTFGMFYISADQCVAIRGTTMGHLKCSYIEQYDSRTFRSVILTSSPIDNANETRQR